MAEKITRTTYACSDCGREHEQRRGADECCFAGCPHTWEMNNTKDWGDGMFTMYISCRKCGAKSYIEGHADENSDSNSTPQFNAETFEADNYKCNDCGSHELRYREYDNSEHNGFFCMNCGQSPCGINETDSQPCTCDMMEYGKYTWLGEKPRTQFPSWLDVDRFKKQEQDKENERIRIVGSKEKLDAIRKGAETFDVEFNEWADQEMMSHGKNISFKDWAKDEGMKHGNTELTDWAQHEDESHDARYGSESLDMKKAQGSNMAQDKMGLTDVERQMVDSFPFNGNLIHWKQFASYMPWWSNFPQAIIEGVVNMNPGIIDGVEYDEEIWFISSKVYSEEHNNETYYGAEIVWYDTKGRSQKEFFEDFMKANRGKKHGDMFNDSNILKYGFGLTWVYRKGWEAEMDGEKLMVGSRDFDDGSMMVGVGTDDIDVQDPDFMEMMIGEDGEIEYFTMPMGENHHQRMYKPRPAHYGKMKTQNETNKSTGGDFIRTDGDGRHAETFGAENLSMKNLGAVAVGSALGIALVGLFTGKNLLTDMTSKLSKASEAKKDCHSCNSNGSVRKNQTQVLSSEYSVGQINPVEVEGQQDVHGAEGVNNPRFAPSPSPAPHRAKSSKWL